MDKFEKYNFSTENKEQVEKYLQKIENFVKENNLEKELYTDIEERFFEKVSESKNINTVEIKKIIAELGEIEDIFGEEVIEENTDTTVGVNEKYTPKEKWISIGIIIFWVLLLITLIVSTNPSSVFSQILIIIIVIVAARWSSNFKNIGGTAKKDISKVKEVFGKLLKKNILIGVGFLAVLLLTVGGVIHPKIFIFLILLSFIFFIIKMLMQPDKNIIKSLCFGLFSIFRVVFFTGFGMLLILGVLGLLAVAGAYFTDFSYKGMQIFNNFPIYFPIGIIFGAVALGVFAVSFISYGFHKKGFGKIFILSGIVSLFIAFFCAFATGFDLYKKYSYSESVNKTSEFTIQKSDKTYELNFIDLMYSSYPNLNFNYIKLKKSKDDKLRITAKMNIHSPKEDIKFFQENISNININQEGNNIGFTFSEGALFGNKTLPLAFSNNYLELEIPENMVFNAKPNYFLNQITIPKKYQILEPYLNANHCETYFYDTDLYSFSCNLDKKIIKEKEKMLQVKYLYTNLSKLSPIKHKEQYKRNYYLEVCTARDNFNCESDWKLDYESVKIKDGIMFFTYSDKSLKIEASSKIEEINHGEYEISDLKIENIDIDSNIFNVKYYEKESLNGIFKGGIDELNTQNISENETKNNIFKSYNSYNAGIFEGDKSLSFDNESANKVIKKVRNNDFLEDWKYPDRYRLDYNGGNTIGKVLGDFSVVTKDSENGMHYIVKKNGKDIYTSEETAFVVEDPFKNFVVNKEGWWLLYKKEVLKSNSKQVAKNILVHNGKVIENAETLNLDMLDGKVFYFFTKDKDSKISFHLDGKVFETNFDDIINNKCCEPATYNMRISADGKVVFWGIIGQDFSYNEMTLPGF